MTATLTRPAPTTSAAERSVKTPTLWRTGLVAGLAAAAATVACAVVAGAAGVPLETPPGEEIPALAFGQLTLFCTAIGVLIARTTRRRATAPRSTFTRITVVLTALSLVPDILVAASTATKLTLMLTHVVAAAIVIPALTARLPE